MRECRLACSHLQRHREVFPLPGHPWAVPVSTYSTPQVPSTRPPAPSIPRVQGLGGFTPNPSLSFSFLAFLHDSMGMVAVGTASWPGTAHPFTLHCDRGREERRKKAKSTQLGSLGGRLLAARAAACHEVSGAEGGRRVHPHGAGARGHRATRGQSLHVSAPPQSPAPPPGVLGVSRALLKQPQLPFSTNPYPSPVPCNCSLFLAGIWDGAQRRIGSGTERYQ